MLISHHAPLMALDSRTAVVVFVVVAVVVVMLTVSLVSRSPFALVREPVRPFAGLQLPLVPRVVRVVPGA
jgi:hypothetical protein